MPEIHVYEPALCCTSGVCGPDLDQALVAFTADVAHVNEAGGHVGPAQPRQRPARVRRRRDACAPSCTSPAPTGFR